MGLSRRDRIWSDVADACSPPPCSCCHLACSQGQRQEHAAFLLPLIEGECYEGVQACLQEALLLCPKPQDRTTTFGSAPAALPGGASPESTQRAQHEQPAAAHPPDSSAVGTTGGGASTSGSGSDGVAAALEHAVAAVTQTA